MSQPKKDPPLATPDGELVGPRIHGMNFRRMRALEDERGDLTELYRPAWGFHPDPLVFVYRVSLRPGYIRGWVVHRKQEDRIVTTDGALTWAFFDDRPDSPTYKLLNVLTFSPLNRTLFNIPIGVYHAVKNVGHVDAVFINMPNRAYDHADPDKFRLPLKNDLIPFDFTQPVRG
jgi:dTDP-4-dehydrorhamnose 3,5-epimerase